MNTAAEATATSSLSLVELDEDWSLWRDFAVRSAGFPVEGLTAFGSDEDARLAAVARDPAFREAVAWQSRESLRRAVDKLGGGVSASPSRQRRWADVVASYWQRYCSKNDTIGFFGPLAWGSFDEAGDDVITFRSGGLQRERVVHLETWAVEAVAHAAGVSTPLPMHPFPERALRPLLDDASPLDRLELARDAVAAAPSERVADALDDLDRVFQEIAGREPVRAEADSGGGRTVAYLDCMRDLDLAVGPPLLNELRESLPPVLHASRWWCGRVFERATESLERLAHGYAGPLAPMLGPLMGAGFGLWDQMGDELAELQRRWAAVVGGAGAAEEFADWTPAWHGATYHSADLQIAAASTDALESGDFLVVLGDFHGGDNPLAQGLFGHRHPDPAAMLRRIAREVGPGVHLSPPRRGVVEMRARSWPLYVDGDVVVASGDEPVPPGTRRVALEDMVVDAGHVTDRARSFRVPLAEFLYLPIFVASVRSFDPVGDGPERAQLGRLVVRRANWSAPAAELPEKPDDLAAWARDRSLPRRVFARSPLERKPRYVDFESPSLRRTLARFLAPAREQAPDRAVEFTEMLPGPDECWLESDAGHHTCELRVVALDRAAARG
jgi:hypothetical protein